MTLILTSMFFEYWSSLITVVTVNLPYIYQYNVLFEVYLIYEQNKNMIHYTYVSRISLMLLINLTPVGISQNIYKR